MGLNFLCSSSSADKSVSMFSHLKDEKWSGNTTIVEVTKSLPNPKPDNYKIINYIEIGQYLVLKLKYLDCTNYEGIKILVFKCKLKDLQKQKLIDPHFSDNKKFISPIARFEPTKEGYKQAVNYVKSL